MSEHKREDSQLADYIQEAYHANRRVYGSPRIHAELRGKAHQLLAQTSGSTDAPARTLCSPPCRSNQNDQQ